MIENVMLDPGVSVGLYRFAKSRWDASSPEDRLRFFLASNMDVPIPAQAARTKFDDLSAEIQRQIIFHMTKYESILR